MPGIVSYGAYIPYWRLSRAAIAATLGSGGGKGSRSVASYDEDSTSLGVEAARIALRSAPADAVVHDLIFCTTAPAYLDKTNATAIHAALALPTSAGAYDAVGAVRSNVMACSLAGAGRGLAVLSDVRTGLPGGADEAAGGDAAAALLFGDGPGVLAETIGGGTATGEFLDRWRTPGDAHSRQWEERFGEHAYGPLADEAIAVALKSAGLTVEDLDHVIVTGLPSRAVASVRRGLGARPEALADDLTSGHRQHRRRPRVAAPDRRARPGRAGADHRRRPAGRRLRRLAAPHHRRHRRLRAGPDRPAAARGHAGRPDLRRLPDLAGLPAPGAAPAARARPPGGPAEPAGDGAGSTG